MKRLGVMVSGLFLAAAPAWADHLPMRKVGLWEVTLGAPGAKIPNITKMCIDASLASFSPFGANVARSNCARNDIRVSGNLVTLDTECALGATKVISHGTFTPQGDSAYHVEIKTHFDPPMSGQADPEMVMVQDGKWTGPCPADIAPGDVLLPDGTKMNMKGKDAVPGQ